MKKKEPRSQLVNSKPMVDLKKVMKKPPTQAERFVHTRSPLVQYVVDVLAAAFVLTAIIQWALK